MSALDDTGGGVCSNDGRFMESGALELQLQGPGFFEYRAHLGRVKGYSKKLPCISCSSGAMMWDVGVGTQVLGWAFKTFGAFFVF